MPSNETSSRMVPGSQMFAESERYEIIEELGRGGMGIVYKATQISIQRTVALKILQLPVTEDPTSLQRFLREGRLCASLDHPNIVKVFGLFVADNGAPFLVMEYLQGQTLADILTQRKTLDEKTFLQVFDQVLSALQCAHDQGLVHRDIKPANILITTDGTTKLMDFGIARSNLTGPTEQGITRTGAIIGSPWYMSPEQCSGAPVDARSDLYSVGCVMYECLVGSRPHSGDNPLEVMYKHINEQLTTTREVEIPLFSELVCKAMAKEPERRYASSDAMRSNLRDGPQDKHLCRRGKKVWFNVSPVQRAVALAGALGLVLCAGIYLPPLIEIKQHQAEDQYSARQLFNKAVEKIDLAYVVSPEEGVALRRQALDYLERTVQQAHKDNNRNLEADAMVSQDFLKPAEFSKDGEAIYKKAHALYESGNPRSPSHAMCLLALSRWYQNHHRPKDVVSTTKDTLDLLGRIPAYNGKDLHVRNAEVLCAQANKELKLYAEANRHFKLAITGADIENSEVLGALIPYKALYAESLIQEQQYGKANEQVEQIVKLIKAGELMYDEQLQLQTDPTKRRLIAEQKVRANKDFQKSLVRLRRHLRRNTQALQNQGNSAKP